MTSLQIVLASLSYGFTIFTLAFLALRVRALIAFFRAGSQIPPEIMKRALAFAIC
jgi:hypothetical protein